MREISHANPYTGETASQLFRRGPVIAADGGRREAVVADDGTGDHRMKNVSHTPPNASEDVNRVFERGGREATGVESEE